MWLSGYVDDVFLEVLQKGASIVDTYKWETKITHKRKMVQSFTLFMQN